MYRCFIFSWINSSRRKQVTYKVLDAKFVSSCFNCPSKARPHLSLLLANNGVKVNTFDRVKPGCTWHPSLLISASKKKELLIDRFHCELEIAYPLLGICSKTTKIPMNGIWWNWSKRLSMLTRFDISNGRVSNFVSYVPEVK